MSSKDIKQIAIDFLQLSSGGRAREAFKNLVGKNFKHHNVYFKGDAETLMNAMEENAKKHPDKVFEIKRSLADGDLAATHSFVRQNPEDPGVVVVHIFRFENDKIVELWDLGQPVPLETVNENGIL